MREAFAEEIDFWSRRFIPVFFFFAIMIVYALEPVDPYSISTSEDGQTVSDDDVRKSLPMYQGLCARHYDQTRDSATAPAAGWCLTCPHPIWTQRAQPQARCLARGHWIRRQCRCHMRLASPESRGV